MVGVNKPFDKTLHSKNDPTSRRVVKAFFAQFDIILEDHPNKFDIDLITEDKKVRVEVERRPIWKSGDFPYDSIHVLERKAKFFKDGNTHYCIVSKDYQWIGFISAENIVKFMTEKYLKENPNKYVSHGEFVYDIPIENFEFYEIKNRK